MLHSSHLRCVTNSVGCVTCDSDKETHLGYFIRVVDGLQNARSESVSTTRSKQSKHYISHVWGAVMKAFEPLKMTPGNTIFQQVVFHYSFRES